MSKKSPDKFQMQHIFRPLKRASKWPIWADVIARLGLAFFLIGIVVLVHWIDRAGVVLYHAEGQDNLLQRRARISELAAAAAELEAPLAATAAALARCANACDNASAQRNQLQSQLISHFLKRAYVNHRRKSRVYLYCDIPTLKTNRT